MHTSVSHERLTGFMAALKAATNSQYDIEPDYLLAANALPSNYRFYKPARGSMAWWVTNNDGTYTIYTFKTYDFINGLIEANEQLGIDFRDYTLGTPYSYDDKNHRINYSIEGYDVVPYTNTLRISAPIGPFYTGSIEDDAVGID